MKNKKLYIPAKATLITLNQNDVICASGDAFDGPGDPLFPKMARVYYEDSELDNL